MDLKAEQNLLANANHNSHIWLDGPVGTGKTTAAIIRLHNLILSGVSTEKILIMVPQRSLGVPYQRFLASTDLPPGGHNSILTFGGLAQRNIDIFWPLIAKTAGFGHPNKPPRFLTLETSQFFMASVMKPLLEESSIDVISLEKHRIYGQVLDNLNKAAVVGFSHTILGERLSNAWIGKPSQLVLYDLAQQGANLFRNYCLVNNLLDFSLQIELFKTHLLPSLLVQSYLQESFTHLIYDNVEEDFPVAHDFIRVAIPKLESSLIICDLNGGYRSFLGADPLSALTIKEQSTDSFTFSHSCIMSPEIDSLRSGLSASIKKQNVTHNYRESPNAFEFIRAGFMPEMLKLVVQSVLNEIQNGTHPGDIAVLTPYLGDSLRFTLVNEFENCNIKVWTHRPSRSLIVEPAAQCLITLAKIAHPYLGSLPSLTEIRSALFVAISSFDYTRADLLSRIVFHPNNPDEMLGDFASIKLEVQNRITLQAGEKYGRLREWIQNIQKAQVLPLDIFFGRLFGEILSQPGFGYHQDFNSAAIAARLIESAQKFRKAVSPLILNTNVEISSEYIRMIDEGVLAAHYFQQDVTPDQDAILLIPSHSFLMRNQPVSVQYWLDISSSGWWERLNQPLTHPYVLSRNWPANKIWTHLDEMDMNQHNLHVLVEGLLHRCRKKVYLCSSGLNQSGREERGPLLFAIQNYLKNIPRELISE